MQSEFHQGKLQRLECSEPSNAAEGFIRIWEKFIPHIGPGESYKFHVVSRYNNYAVDKADPFAFHCRNSAEDRIGGLGSGLYVDRLGLDCKSPCTAISACADVDL